MKFVEMAKKSPEGKTVVELVEQTGDKNFGLVITEDGIRVRGESPMFRTHAELEPLAKAIGRAVIGHAELVVDTDKEKLINTPVEPAQPELGLVKK